MPLSRWAVFCIHFRPPVTGRIRGRMPEWSIGADCKSAGLTPFEGSNPSPTTIFFQSSQSPVSCFQIQGVAAEVTRRTQSEFPVASYRTPERTSASNLNLRFPDSLSVTAPLREISAAGKRSETIAVEKSLGNEGDRLRKGKDLVGEEGFEPPTNCV